MAARSAFTEEEMVVDEGIGYPKSYAKLCQDPTLNPHCHGPPFTFFPYSCQHQEDLRAKELDEMFPIVYPETRPTAKPRNYASLLWKQLHHLGNAGFDPEIFRVDPYGNVLYYHADSGSPLSWSIDHWFPCSRGGRTVPGNLRILQWQVCKKKHNKLEFLVPWWDLQLGISVNQFLNIFASSNSNFRYRAFSFLFPEGESEELNDSQTVQSHTFPKHFVEAKRKIGLAPAAIVLSRRESSEASSALISFDLNGKLRPKCAATASRNFVPGNNQAQCYSIQKYRTSISKENENPNMAANPYMAIAMARDSLRQMEEAESMQAEIQTFDEELDEMMKKTEVERVALQDLELVLMKRRRRAEKCRRLAEAQSSYRAIIEKMIRDAMHQSVVYKEQIRLNQAATCSLMARLEAQKAICDSSEKELHIKFKQRREIEEQIRPQWDQPRKRLRMDDDDSVFYKKDDEPLLYLPEISSRREHLQKELRVFLEEEQKASEAGLSLNEERKQEDVEERNELIIGINREKAEDPNRPIPVMEDEIAIEENLRKLEIKDDSKENMRISNLQSPEREEDEECRKQRGKGNVEKWLQMLLDDTEHEPAVNSPPQNVDENGTTQTEELIRKLNLRNPQKQQIKVLQFPASENKIDGDRKQISFKENDGNLSVKTNAREVDNVFKGVGGRMSFEGKERREKSGKERGLVRSESARSFRPFPSSPSVTLGTKKGTDCMRKKPIVFGFDEGGDEGLTTNGFIKSSIKTMKRPVKM